MKFERRVRKARQVRRGMTMTANGEAPGDTNVRALGTVEVKVDVCD
jgi:hypothetical protein